jgi:hypothetical protein
MIAIAAAQQTTAGALRMVCGQQPDEAVSEPRGGNSHQDITRIGRCGPMRLADTVDPTSNPQAH